MNMPNSQKAAILELQARIKADQAKVDDAKLQVAYTKIIAPMTGVLGLRMVDPGNTVQANSPLVVITQLQPIAVLFTVPEDNVRNVRARLNAGASPLVEAWDRTNSTLVAAGHLTAIDNQIDATTGTVKLKAVFDNKDGALFPNQFVNVHLFLNGR
jgi:membrane fusion protein, multidrug efflux system